MRISDWSSDVCSSDLVYETVGRLSRELPAETTLIGFAGAPWTVASYMLEGGSSKDFATSKRWAYGAPEAMQRLIDLLVEASGDFPIAQIDAGAEAVQIRSEARRVGNAWDRSGRTRGGARI